MLPSQLYEKGVALGKIEPDETQRTTLSYLDTLVSEIRSAKLTKAPLAKRKGIIDVFLKILRLFKTTPNGPSISGLYMWGGVGRGKTFLMDLFVDSAPDLSVLRTHYHQFMQDVHESLQDLKGTESPLIAIAKDYAKRYRVLCLDEFFVKDIGDAMILSGLIKALFEHELILVTTSNVEPDKLYENGLQRDRFLSAIERINTHTKVIELDIAHDYRSFRLANSQRYIVLTNDNSPFEQGSTSLANSVRPSKAEELLAQFFNAFEAKTTPQDSAVSMSLQDQPSLAIMGRKLLVKAIGSRVLWASFAQLCDGPRSQRDYLALTKEFSFFILENVPVLSESDDSLVRRFIYLIDVLYEQHCKLVISANAELTKLYTGSELQFEFDRTMSRLHEMQSDDYFLS